MSVGAGDIELVVDDGVVLIGTLEAADDNEELGLIAIEEVPELLEEEAVANDDEEELVLTIGELDIEEGLLAVDVAAVDEMLRIEEDVIAEEEPLEVGEATMDEDELLLAEELDAMLNELESETAPATLRAAFVAPLYTNAPEVDFG